MKSFTKLFCLLACFNVLLVSCNEQNKPLQLKDTKVPTYEKLHKLQQIKERLAQEKEMTMDPKTGIVPRKDLFIAQQEMWAQQEELSQKTSIPNVTWEERGPDNIGGRTRAIMFDPNDGSATKVWAGGVGGGLWFNDDITDANSMWQNVDDFWSNMAVTSIDHDPVLTNNFYAGTGEGFGNADAIDGDGIWKTTDGGTTWNQLNTTTNFNDVNKIVCFKEDGIVVATNNGLRVSTNGGASWLTPRSGSHADVEVAANGDLYASNFSGDIFKSTNDGSNWTTVRNGSGNRIELATAPSDSDVVYALVNTGTNVTDILRTANGGITWLGQTIPPYLEQGSCADGGNPFTRGQGWYDLISLVHPTDPDRIIIGGIDLWRSDDGGTNWESISYWTGQCDDFVHADQHALISRPGFDNAVLVGNDGGLSFSSDAFDFGANPNFDTRNNGYNVTQYYAVAIHPSNTTINILGGTQDNGTHRFTQPGINSVPTVTGGDGAFCHIDQNEPLNQITSFVFNNYFIATNGTNFTSYSYGNFGRFINPTDYDNDANILYAASNANEYFRISNIGGTPQTTNVTVNEFAGTVSAVRVSPNVANRVYFGVNVNGGKILQIDDAHSSSPTVTELGTTANGYISSIDVEVGDEDHMLVTLSNFNITSVWESTNGGANFSGVEGDLPNMPVRWGIFDPNSSAQAILGTELGVWTTTFLNGSSTDWNPTNSGLANTRVDMIEYRPSDNLMVAGTHGRGVFTSTSFNLGCNINISSIGPQNCDVTSNTYTQEITLDLTNTPPTGDISVLGQTFSIPNNQASTTVTVTLAGLIPDGNAVDVTIFFTADNSCQKDFVGLFVAPNSGCTLDNNVCAEAQLITGTGTYDSNGPADGSGCHNCGSAVNADWFKFTPTSSGTIDIASCGYGEDTRFWVYSGDCTSLTSVANNDDACILGMGSNNPWASEVLDIPVVAGTTYFIEWDDRWSSDPFTFDFTFNGSGGCAGQAHRFVDNSLSAAGDGCTWATAFNDLQAAIGALEADATITELWIKEGTYLPGSNRSNSFEVSENAILYGGFDGTESSLGQRDFNAHITMLSGDIGMAGITSDNSYHVISHTNGTAILTLDGLTISNGNSNSGDGSGGGGIYNTAEVTVKNCIISDNLSTTPGSGICNDGANAMMTVESSTLKNNAGIQYCLEGGGDLVVPAGTTITIEN